MDGSAQPFPAEQYDRIWPGRWRDWQILLVLLTLALLLRGWSLWQTEVPARDSIGFIRYALWLEKTNWQTVIRSQHQHPGYPMSVLLVSWPVRWCAGTTDCYNMQLSAQIVSMVAGLLLVLPMFFLGKHLFGRAVGFWSALLFQCMPGSGPVLSDAISDPLFLCLVTTGLMFGVRAVSGNRLRPFALCGVFTGLAYMVRPEGALIVAATGLVLLAMQFVPRWRRYWRVASTCAAVLIASAVLTGSPLWLTIPGFTTKPSASLLIGRMEAEADEPSIPQALLETTAGPLFAVHIDMQQSLLKRMGLGVRAIGAELSHALQYFGIIPVLLSLWWCRDRYRTLAGAWVLFALFVLHGTLVWLLAVKVGYVSDRHILLLVLCCLFQAVAATLQIPFRLGNWWQARAERRTSGKGLCARRGILLPAASWALLLMFVCTGAGLSRTLRPLHGNRMGHHAAGKWLADHSRPADRVEDDHCWAHYYAGRVFRESQVVPPVNYDPVTYYVVSRAAKEQHWGITPRQYREEDLIARGGKIVFQWPEDVANDKAQVVIYQLNGS